MTFGARAITPLDGPPGATVNMMPKVIQVPNPAELSALLEQLLADWENEVVEFKQAGDAFSTSEIGKYFSALANEANLRGVPAGWLVFGVSDKTHAVAGTSYRPERERLNSLKMQVADDSAPSTTFREIHEIDDSAGRVLLMEIPATPRGIPIAWKGHYYARAGESLVSLPLDKLDEIRRQTADHDWSAVIVRTRHLTISTPKL